MLRRPLADCHTQIDGSRHVTFSSRTTGDTRYDLSSVCTGADCADPMVQTLNGGMPPNCSLSVEWPLIYVGG